MGGLKRGGVAIERDGCLEDVWGMGGMKRDGSWVASERDAVIMKRDERWVQWWANLDQAPKDLDKTIFRDLSPTPIP